MKNNLHFLTINPESIHINELTLTTYLGYKKDTCPESVLFPVKDILSQFHQYLRIKAGWVRFNSPDITIRSGKIMCKEIEFLCGKNIAGNLKNSGALIIFLLTIGSGIEEWSKTQIKNNNPLYGYLIDLLGSIVTEYSVDILYNTILGEVSKKGFFLTNRYSPGYCGWDVSEQHKLFSFFPKGFCGITLTDSALMVPVKSVSGIIGSGPHVKKQAYQCESCPQKECLMKMKKKKNIS